MEEELDDASSVAVEVFLQIHDRTIPVVPDRLVVVWRAGNPFAAENFAVHADDQHLLVVRPIEDADPPALRQFPSGAPKKIVFQFGWAGMFEAEYLAALRVDPGHDVPDSAVLSRRIHGLKDQQDGIAIGRVEKLLL